MSDVGPPSPGRSLPGRSLPTDGAVLVLACLVLATWTPRGAHGQSLSVSGDPGTLIVDSAVPGSEPDPVTDATTTYDVTVLTLSKIVGRLDSSMPTGVEVRVELEAPNGAVSQGVVTLTTSDQDLVTDVGSGTYSGLAITYELVATVDAGTTALDDRTVTLSVVQQ